MSHLYTWWNDLFSIIKRARLFGRSSNILDIQAANGIVVSDTQTRSTSINVALIYWYSWCKFLRQCYRVGKLYNEFGYSFSWPSDETPRLSKGKNVIECSIENFVSVVAVIKQKALPSMKSSTGKANLEREQEVERTMLDLLQPFTEGLEVRDASSSVPKASYDSKREVFEEQSITENLLSVVTDSGQDTLAKETKSKKGIICPQTRGNRNVFIHYPKDPNCEVCKKTKPTRARCRIKLENRVDGIAISKKFGDLKFDQFRSQILNVENEPRVGSERSSRAQWFHELHP